ncbi:carbohydrate ABC transporter permease [Paenibacillaceae bacterium WGS1546]|uniref:carbohydrate ABC transporter permease n=1 Tax=Cohnella sp. WGS1546 TaxID=3366810 RepID=UPI00372D1717
MFAHTSKWVTVGIQGALTLLAVLFAVPLVLMIGISLQGRGFDNYVAILTHPLIPRFFLNSAIVSFCTISIVYVATSLAAYAFSKLELKGKTVLFNLILLGMMIPAVSLIVPLFITVKKLHMIDSYLSLIGPYTALTLPFTLLLMRNFLDELPNQLLDAAKIDGCGTFQTYVHIIVPLTKPIAVVVVIWTFLSSWNEYFMPLVFMQSESMRVITQAPQFFTGQYSQDTGKVFASLVLISLPVTVAYLSMQKFFEDGMTAGSIK